MWRCYAALYLLQLTVALPTHDESEVHFPGLLDRFKKQVTFGAIAPCPNNEDFCETANDYPANIIVSPAASVTRFIKDKIFANQKDQKKIKEAVANKEKISARSGLPSDLEFIEESRACRHRASVVYPKKAKNTNGEFKFIVNTAEYAQAVAIEQCEGEGEPCETDGDAPQMNVESTICRQKFTTYKFYAINGDGEEVYDSFSLPSACLCFHKSSFSIRGISAFEPNVNVRERSGGNSLQTLDFCPRKATPFTETVDLIDPILPQPPVAPLVASPARVSPTVASSTSSSRIRFQRQAPERRNRQRRPFFQPTACSDSSNINEVVGFCDTDDASFDTIDNYPVDSINSLLHQDSQVTVRLFQEVFNSSCNSIEEGIQTRFFAAEDPLCDSRPRVIFPRKALNLDEKWMYVVNLGNYTQSVEIEECVDQSSRRQFGRTQAQNQTEFGVCLYGGAEGHNPDFTVCKQLYTEHKLLAFTGDSELVVDRFKLPSACACFTRTDFNAQPGFRSADQFVFGG